MFCFSTHASVAISSKWSVLCESCSFKQNSDCNFFLNLNMVLEIHLASAMDILLPSPGHCFEARVLTKQKKLSKEGSCHARDLGNQQPQGLGFHLNTTLKVLAVQKHGAEV